jgi:hypothetical protein
MIVNVTRDDLRDEFTMADEAFALSPISARAAQPSEEDYEAIRQAFMETSRGRWFLGEYAKRNRNADTSMVLDAVARIEETLAAQQPPASDNRLAEALAAIRRAVDEASGIASAAIDGLALEENLAPVRKAARVVREISWRWREIGADGRICDLIDSQVSAIEGACGQISSRVPLGALAAAFDVIRRRIEEFGESEEEAAQAFDEAVPSSAPHSPAPSYETSAAGAQRTQATSDAEAAVSAPPMPAEADTGAAEAAEMTVEAADVGAEAADPTPEAADAYDDTLLDMIALEMAAPDETATAEIHEMEAPPVEPEAIARQAEPMQSVEPTPAPVIQASVEPTPRYSLEASVEPSPEPSLKAPPEPSLGSTLIASGIVQRPRALQSDPLAPIRRMSQAEKIALFS